MDESEEPRERPIRTLRRKRLSALITEFGGPRALADKTSTVDTHLIACEKGRRDVGDELATKLEAGAGKPFGWMDGAISDEALRFAQIFDRLTNPETREAVLVRALQVIARDFPAASEPQEAPRLPTDRRLQRS